MSTPSPDSDWFFMRDVRRRLVANAGWIPLRQSETRIFEGTRGALGERSETTCTGSVAIYSEHRAYADTLGWSDIGLIHEARPCAFEDGRYKPADAFMRNDKDVVGFELVLEDRTNAHHPTRWLINQDVVLALGLIEEGDVWRRPDEGYAEVIRSRRDNEGRVVALEMKAEFLRDYLAARGAGLRLAQYRQRLAVLADASRLSFAQEPVEERSPGHRFTAQVYAGITPGGLFGRSVAVFQTGRVDVDDEEDVPVFGPGNDSNTWHRSATFEGTGPSVMRAEAQWWHEEWIEPAARSERVRGDRPDEDLQYTVAADGSRMPASALNDEDIGRYLWFRANVIPALLAFRGSGLEWYSAHTGSVRCSPGDATHFGVNRNGHITVYAYDVAKLPVWQQRVWAGFNITPDGPVASELLDSQQRCLPAPTRAPESTFVALRERIDELFEVKYNMPLFRPHPSTGAILRSVHRFRAIDAAGLLALAKDIARVTADSIDQGVLASILKPPKDTSWRSLKHLEEVLASLRDRTAARAALTPLVGIYELRLGDAHLASSKLGEAFSLAGVDAARSSLEQGLQVIDAASRSLEAIRVIVE